MLGLCVLLLRTFLENKFPQCLFSNPNQAPQDTIEILLSQNAPALASWGGSCWLKPLLWHFRQEGTQLKNIKTLGTPRSHRGLRIEKFSGVGISSSVHSLFFALFPSLCNFCAPNLRKTQRNISKEHFKSNYGRQGESDRPPKDKWARDKKKSGKTKGKNCQHKGGPQRGWRFRRKGSRKI